MSKALLEQPGASPSKTTIMLIILKVLAFILVISAILFISANRLNWRQAYLFVLTFAGFLVYYGWWGLRNDPDLMNERSRIGKNTKPWDKVILIIYSLLLVTMLVLAGLDAGRFNWAPAPFILQIAGWSGYFSAGYMILWTASVNTYLSRTVRIQDDRGHQVIDTGPYSRVRHPMYLSVIVIMISIPLVLGSLWALVPGGLIGILFIVRTALEDLTLIHELSGYFEYTRRVHYRLFPGIW